MVVLADHTKIGQDTMCQTVPVARVQILITDAGTDLAEIAAIREAGVDVRVAQVGRDGHLESATA